MDDVEANNVWDPTRRARRLSLPPGLPDGGRSSQSEYKFWVAWQDHLSPVQRSMAMLVDVLVYLGCGEIKEEGMRRAPTDESSWLEEHKRMCIDLKVK